jgi:hypothetical protein
MGQKLPVESEAWLSASAGGCVKIRYDDIFKGRSTIPDLAKMA